MSRALTISLAVGLLSLLFGSPAVAHSGLMPSRIAPGSTETSELVVVHGCGEDGTIPGGDDRTFATTGITLEVPQELVVEPHAAEGWALATEADEQGRIVRARWDHEDPAGTLDTVRFDVDITAPDVAEGTQLWLPVIQDCTDGERLAWTYPGTEGSADGQHPATLLTVEAPSTPSGGGSGVPTSVLVTLVAALAIGSGAVVYVISGRRA